MSARGAMVVTGTPLLAGGATGAAIGTGLPGSETAGAVAFGTGAAVVGAAGWPEGNCTCGVCVGTVPVGVIGCIA